MSHVAACQGVDNAAIQTVSLKHAPEGAELVNKPSQQAAWVHLVGAGRLLQGLPALPALGLPELLPHARLPLPGNGAPRCWHASLLCALHTAR